MPIDTIKKEYTRIRRKYKKKSSLDHLVFKVKLSKSNQDKFKKYLLESISYPLKFDRKEGVCFIYTNKTSELEVRRFIFYQILKLEKDFEFNGFELKCDKL